MTEVRRRASKVLEEIKEPRFLWYGIEAALDALDRAGLLVSPLHERALEACRQHAIRMKANLVHREPTIGEWGTVQDETLAVYRVGREALAAEKEPRYLRCDCGERRMSDAGSTGAGTDERHSVTKCERAVYDRIPKDTRLP